MYPVSDTFKEIKPLEQDGKPYWYWIYDPETEDFHLKLCHLSYHLTTEAYKISIGGKEVMIPSDYNLAISSEEGDIDWIRPTEIVGRDFDALVITRTLTQGIFSMEAIKTVGFEPEYQYVLPFTKHILPIAIGDNKAILVAEADIYNRYPHLHVSDIV